MGIIIGLGSGRSGTLSLSKLINHQNESICFHEINPSCMKWSGSEGTVISMINEFETIISGGDRNLLTIDYSVSDHSLQIEKFKSMDKVTCIGEIGFYYLNYVEDILTKNPNVKFPCIKRDKNSTIQSYSAKMISNQKRSKLNRLLKIDLKRNHFMNHNGKQWLHDRIWDKCFPKFEASSLEEAIGLYWEHYYQEAEVLAEKFPQVKIFDLNELNTPEGQKSLLNFCGYDNPSLLTVHENKKLE